MSQFEKLILRSSKNLKVERQIIPGHSYLYHLRNKRYRTEVMSFTSVLIVFGENLIEQVQGHLDCNLVTCQLRKKVNHFVYPPTHSSY